MTKALSWSDLKIQTSYGTKSYWKKYFYKMSVKIDLAPYLRDKKSSLNKETVKKYRPPFNYNFGSWYFNYHRDPAEDWQVEEVIAVGIALRRARSAKYVIDYNIIDIYTVTEEELLSIARDIHRNLKGRTHVIQQVLVPDPSLEKDISEGCEILKTDVGYTHKVILKDCSPGYSAKKQLLQYLDSLGEDMVKISPTVREMLELKGPYLYGGWFRINDPSILTFIELVAPGIVLKISRTIVKK